MSPVSKRRREFLRTAAHGISVLGLATGSGWRCDLGAEPLGLPIGVQLGWLERDCERNLEGTLKTLAEIGYGEVEAFAPFFQRTPGEFRRILDAQGLRCPSAHWIASDDKREFEARVEGAKEIGLEFLFGEASVESLDDCKRSADSLNKIGEQCKLAGLRLAVHNHHYEFRTFDHVVAYDVIVGRTEARLVTFQLDCFWCTYAGKDPVDYLERYPGRFSLLHIKDLKPGFIPSTEKLEGQPFTEVGRGVINWRRIFAAAPRAGVEHYFVEQDICDREPLESARISYGYLKQLRV